MSAKASAMPAKTWALSVLLCFALLLLLGGALTAFFDPYFHFHGKLSFLQYPLNDERYQNNGILRHFDYDAVITGSSMTECFRTSELDALFGTTSVKVPYSGGSYREIGETLRWAAKYNDHLRLVVRGLDYSRMFEDKDYSDYPAEMYPTYLYDDNPFNDVKYVLNKTTLFTDTYDVFGYTRSGKKTISFDEYCNWTPYYPFGEEALKEAYHPEVVAVIDEQLPFTDEDSRTIYGSITQNVTSIADENPDTQYYIFFPPISIYYFDFFNRRGLLDRHLKGERYIIELLLEHENIHIFSFFWDEETICNPDNYRDIGHYHEDINSKILAYMHEGTGELTRENYEAYCEAEWDFFHAYDYDALFADWGLDWDAEKTQ